MWGQQEVALCMAGLAWHSSAEQSSAHTHTLQSTGFSPCGCFSLQTEICFSPSTFPLTACAGALPPAQVLLTPTHRKFLQVHICGTKTPSWGLQLANEGQATDTIIT